MERSGSDRWTLWVGLAVIATVGFGLYIGIRSAYRYFVPLPHQSITTVALSAYFDVSAESKTLILRIAGTVLEDGKLVPEGRARLVVERMKTGARQSVIVDVKDGRFEASDEPAFRGISPGDRLHIGADVSKTGTPRLGSEEVYVNARPPFAPQVLWVGAGILALISAVFAWAFTGVSTPGKNQGAIVLSYFNMLVFLALPLIGPYYVARRGSVVSEENKELPMGFLIASPARQLGSANSPRQEPQWVINIGGWGVAAVAEAATWSKQDTQKESARELPGTNADTMATSNGKSAAAPRSKTVPAGTAVQRPEANQSVQNAKETAPESASKPDRDGTPPVTSPSAAPVIYGGLVIPLYVLVLSMIGGAINMTRKLPQFQTEVATFDTPFDWFGDRAMTVGRGIRSLLSFAPRQKREEEPASGYIAGANDVPGGAPHTTETSIAVATEAEFGRSQTGGAEAQISVKHEREMTPAEKAALWREEVIRQHMYLLSAPFLAIAVYYMLEWLDMLKTPVLVLVSFSVGLISEKIIGTILNWAQVFVEQRTATDTVHVTVPGTGKRTSAASA